MILLDYRDKRPIYEQVIERLQDLILQGILEKDERMPSVRSLAMELSINPNTIQRAYAELENRGLIYSVKGKGNFVADCTAIRDDGKKTLLYNLQMLVQNCRQAGISKNEAEIVLNDVYQNSEDGGDRS